MNKLTSRERVLRAINHSEVDRVPIDIGGDAGIVPAEYDVLCDYLGISNHAKSDDLWSVKHIDERILRKLGSDCYHIFMGSPQPEVVSNGLLQLQWGLIVKQANPLWYYPDSLAPLKDAKTVHDINEYPYWPDPQDPIFIEGKREEAEYLHENTDYAIVAHAELAGCIFHMYSYIRGFENWLLDLKINPSFYYMLTDKITEVAIKVSREYFTAVGDYIDIITLEDDMGTQRQPIMSVQDFRKFVKPWLKRYVDEIKKITSAKFMLHSCGSIYPLVNDIIDIGFHILNPIQPRAQNMEPERLKREFGDRICFDGGIDTQRLLPFGTVDEVRKEVKKVVDIFGKEGGYILGSSNEIPLGVPPQNIVAMYEAAKESG